MARDRSWEAHRLAVRLQDPSGAGLSYAFAVCLAMTRGNAAEIPADFFDFAAASPQIPIITAGLARALLSVGRTDEARAVYDTLRGLPAVEADRLDMPGPASRAKQLTQELGHDIRTGDPLTRREREIAELVSAGLTNRAIADQLVLSERTVEGHMRNMLAKLQLTNRTELAAWIRPGRQTR